MPAPKKATAVKQVAAKHRPTIALPLFGTVPVPELDQLAYYGGVAALAALELIEWPIAAIVAAGHVLAHNRHNKALAELGEALEQA
ncbi:MULTISPECIES: hypothetical protein [Mycobacterium]|uniref:Uncharacterized protein n=3 Tax=Mycobacterium TaxID=1763 RepID=A0A7I9Y3S1_9MYCO|nr:MULTISPECIES: hypothetical protein [Mycobacterium]EID12921.1 hypothetical protein MXEN_11961 [Mycobacterium xenopi RIVM700367]KMV23332.1 hypothetical protein ACT16_06550 [Mycobacterium heckeshornense]MCV7232751.1 hypothetical protein [Mycobacterium branderi]ORA40890.1 hypothetical protein BST20_01710 [Mycobacterium branderi]PIB80578.1 hypothetical protein CQY23_03285 [Mycobacterium celatum]